MWFVEWFLLPFILNFPKVSQNFRFRPKALALWRLDWVCVCTWFNMSCVNSDQFIAVIIKHGVVNHNTNICSLWINKTFARKATFIGQGKCKLKSERKSKCINVFNCAPFSGADPVFVVEGDATLDRVADPIYFIHFLKNPMKSKKFWSVGGVLLRSATLFCWKRKQWPDCVDFT